MCTMRGKSLKNPVILLAIIILLSLFCGCVYVNPLVQVGEANATPDQATALQVCQITCENHIRFLPLGCICPDTSDPVPGNATASPAGI